jgi:hypothetical protein
MPRQTICSRAPTPAPRLASHMLLRHSGAWRTCSNKRGGNRHHTQNGQEAAMESIFGSIDPTALVGLSLVGMLLGCAAVLYRMRDRTQFPHYVARRLRCPHTGRTFTVEFAAGGDAVFYCSAFDFGELPCDQACSRAAPPAHDATVVTHDHQADSSSNRFLPRFS